MIFLTSFTFTQSFVTFHFSLFTHQHQASRFVDVCCRRRAVSRMLSSHFFSDFLCRKLTPLNQSSLLEEHFDSNLPTSILDLKKVLYVSFPS
ncbi:hypothetical protein Q3G72_034848 [Acer saccharum]|nr:hypothetical protein Q3G72_034848 [Acer saccharum]